MNKALALIAATLTLLLSACSQPEAFTGQVVGLVHTEATVDTERRCNGSPNLLICGDVDVAVPEAWTVEIETPAGAPEAMPDTCSLSIDADRFAELTEGAAITFLWSSWTGCTGV